jgi:hypothetical protein
LQTSWLRRFSLSTDKVFSALRNDTRYTKNSRREKGEGFLRGFGYLGWCYDFDVIAIVNKLLHLCGSDALITAFSSGFILSLIAPFTIMAIASLA